MRDLYSTDLEGAAHLARADAMPDDPPDPSEYFEGPDHFEGPTDADVPVAVEDFIPRVPVTPDDDLPF